MMRYWGYLLAKLAAWFLAMLGILTVVEELFPLPPPPQPKWGPQPALFLHDLPFTFAIFAVWLLGAGLLAIIFWDSRRRCRTCLRRLIMPMRTGSWGNMVVFGRPRTEWICPYGHGTLRVEDLQITGKLPPDWEPHGEDIWKELESYDHTHS